MNQPIQVLFVFVQLWNTLKHNSNLSLSVLEQKLTQNNDNCVIDIPVHLNHAYSNNTISCKEIVNLFTS